MRNMRVHPRKWPIFRTDFWKLAGLFKCERGSFLIEMLVAIALLSIIGTSLLLGMTTASKSLFSLDEMQTAKSLAGSQMEYVKKLPYVMEYVPEVLPAGDVNAGYTVAIVVTQEDSRDLNIQKISITVSHGGRPIIMEMQGTSSCTLEGYKVN